MRFIVITDQARKRRLRGAAEAEERAAYVIPVGYPARDARVPDVRRKELEDVMVRL